MRQSTTAPPPRSWSHTEGYDREQRDFTTSNSQSSSNNLQNQNPANGPPLRRSASIGSNDDQDNAPVGAFDFCNQVRACCYCSISFGQLKLTAFVSFRPADINIRFTCRIQRHREGIDRLNPRYDLFLQNLATNEVQWLLTAVKKRQSQTSYYSIFGSVHDESLPADQQGRGNQVKLAKVRSNFLGTNFSIYSNGRNPSKSFSEYNENKLNADIREELGAVIYEPNILGFRGPRKMTVLLHTMSKTGERIKYRPTKESQSLLAQHKQRDAENILALHNKSPQWNEETQSFVLNFNGRVTQASVKNFQIVHDNDLDYIVMQFGKIDQDNFTMDFRYPLSPIQAFSIALSSFDAKLACE
ncbi:hypothetical protein INT43_000978 [Umbelopsis isabellina]|uniref:Tubby C-terminal domain-containing protein n=1 Tax=Mortierella isabellina TaxID=91625 RepID=A0A8H7Q3W6_MORIS|nr:hypothetical protein INT43_000978 [Umbelopsis isabellina]